MCIPFLNFQIGRLELLKPRSRVDGDLKGVVCILGRGAITSPLKLCRDY